MSIYTVRFERPWFVRVTTALLLASSCAHAATQSKQANLQIDLAQEAQALDAVIAQARSEHGVAANKKIDDLTFARRAWLDLGGRIPTPEDLKQYLSFSARDRRGQLIDHIVGSAAWDSHRYNQLADMMRVNQRLQGTVPGHVYVDWLKQQVRDNLPYDQLARELITATGSIWEPDNGKVGYLLRNRGMNEDHTALTVQYFLGTRIQCAQCHDHPDDYFSRSQFLSLAALDHGANTTAVMLNKVKYDEVRDVARTVKTLGASLPRVKSIVTVGVREESSRKKIVPHDYQYSDLKPGNEIAPRPLWGRFGSQSKQPRGVLADWITNERDPMFASVLANRLWAQYFGRGLVEPVDDWRKDNPPADREVMKALTQLVIRCAYDVELISRIMLRTDAYQRAMSLSLEAGVPPVAGPVMRRLSAEQIWDSFVAQVVPRADERKLWIAGDFRELYKRMAAANKQQLARILGEIAAGRNDWNGDSAKARNVIEKAVAAVVKAEAAGNQGQVKKAENARDRAYQNALDTQMMAIEIHKGFRHPENVTGVWSNFDSHLSKGWVRASEVEQPARPTHFLRIFGQSDRQSPNAESVDGGTVQLLSLMNDMVDGMLLSPNSQFLKVLNAQSSDGVATVYEALLQRKPTSQERKIISATVSSSTSRDALADVVWAIVNGVEFIHYR